MSVIRRGNVILATVRCMYHKRQERLRQKPLANIACHAFKLPDGTDPARVADLWHPSRMPKPITALPEVSAALRPPATVCQPCGLLKWDKRHAIDERAKSPRRGTVIGSQLHRFPYSKSSGSEVVICRPTTRLMPARGLQTAHALFLAQPGPGKTIRGDQAEAH